jgi:hypothetical protein
MSDVGDWKFVEFYVPPVVTPALPGRGHVCRVWRDLRRRCVEGFIVHSRGIERRVGHIAAERRVIPELVLIEELEARHVEQRVEGRPEIAVIARVLLHRAVEHVMRHPPAHFVFVGIAQVLRGVERVHEHVERVIKPCVLPARWANEQYLCQWRGVREDEGRGVKRGRTFGKNSEYTSR